MAQPEICVVPRFLELEFREEQKLTKTFTLTNLIDRVVTYKIKSNHPELYLVKPMEGSIFNRDSVKITFIRMALSRQDFESYLHSANPVPQEKFLIEFKYSDQDPTGKEKSHTQAAYVTVRFHAELRQCDEEAAVAFSLRQKARGEELEKLREAIKTHEKQLTEISNRRQAMEEKGNSGKEGQQKVLNWVDVGYLIVLALLTGLAL